MPRKKKPHSDKPGKQNLKEKPTVHKGLKGFDIRVNSFGEMESTFEVDRLNDFLNKEVHDKKLDNPVDEEE